MKKEYKIIISLLVIFSLWMITGIFTQNKQIEITNFNKKVTLETIQVNNIEVNPTIIAYGYTKPYKYIEIKNKIEQYISDIYVENGQYVESGDLLISLDHKYLLQKLEYQKAFLDQKKSEYNATKKLDKRGFSEKNKIKAKYAELELAKSELLRIEDDLNNSNIKAPFSGIIYDKNAEIGQLANKSSNLFKLVNNKFLLININIPQSDVDHIDIDSVAHVSINNKSFNGIIKSIAPNSEKETKTYNVEILLANGIGNKSGKPATVTLYKPTKKAIKISPAMLFIDSNGNIGVRIISNDKVKIKKVEIVKAENSEVYISGLNNGDLLITKGYGFVNEGDVANYQIVKNQ